MNFVAKAKQQIREELKNRTLRIQFQNEANGVHDYLNKYPQSQLTAVQKKEIDDFWRPYGINVKDYSWYQWYYGKTGIVDPRFLPQEYYLHLILPYYNRQEFIQAYKDKNMFDLILPSSDLPKTIFKRKNGALFDRKGEFISCDLYDKRIIKLILEYKEVVFKNATDTGRGINVKKYIIDGEETVRELLNNWSQVKDFVVQEVIQQHSFFAQFNTSSVNIMRINTWFNDGDVIVSTPVLRFGMPGQATDCCFVDGEEVVRMIGITLEGKLREKIVHLSGIDEELDIAFPNIVKQVPAWDKVVSMLQRNAKKLCHFKCIGWDVTVTKNEEPVVIEYNIFEPSSYASQITNGPMWGEHTEKMLEFLKNDDFRHQYVLKDILIKK